MDPQVKQLWVEALRSGKYKQGQNRLADDLDHYCCLGVLCEVAISQGLPITKSTSEHGRITYDAEKYNLPMTVVKWAGLQGFDPTIPEIRGRRLSNINDEIDYFGYGDKGTIKNDFNVIADLIEANL